jgi:soluble lytic murein transglycosylase-like protein
VQKTDAYREDIVRVAETYGVDEALIRAVIQAESGFRPTALSPKGAMGLMQLMPTTARRYGVVNPYDPVQNIDGGTRYLRDLLHMFDNDLELVVAAYNAGENAVIRHGRRIPPYSETQVYVPKVVAIYEKLRTGM